MRPPGLLPFQDLYLVYELMDTDLHQVIRSPQARIHARSVPAATGGRASLVASIIVAHHQAERRR
jgi:hypothetical protein